MNQAAANGKPNDRQPALPAGVDDDILVDVSDLYVKFFLREGTVRAVDGVSFQVKRGRTLGVVGESGCGKSITARSLLQIVPKPGRIDGGQILFNRAQAQEHSTQYDVVDIAHLDPKGKPIRDIRGAEISMIFQEPMTSLSPVYTIANQIIEAIRLHQDVSKKEARAQAIALLGLVGMPRPEQTIDNYPYQLSGGMRQRAMIAMALSCRPSLLIADEPTTALDVTTEAQILELMRELQQDLGMAILYITHNLGVIAEMAEDVIVMYLGRIVESTDIDSLFYNPQHPYTRNLLESIPKMGKNRGERLQAIEGMVPDPFSWPTGCPFHPRCQEKIDGLCDVAEPPVVEVAPGHTVRCHLYAEDAS